MQHRSDAAQVRCDFRSRRSRLPTKVAAMPTATRIHRDVVSYVRRSARMNPSQQRAWDAHHDDWVLDVPSDGRDTSIAADAEINWTAAFGRSGPLLVEIGSGMGHAIAAGAQANPEANLVAFEVFTPAVASTLGRLARQQVGNVRVVIADGAQALATVFDDASITELWTFFPDPWHKSRHQKRRLVSAEFAELVTAKLVPGGIWRLATDWADYAQAMREVLDAAPGLHNLYSGWAPRFAGRPVTKYEQRGLSAGRTIYDLAYAR
jgi:tRNA (guanine-N7-)-methyltransferase